jgi:hypothetical protein
MKKEAAAHAKWAQSAIKNIAANTNSFKNTGWWRPVI